MDSDTAAAWQVRCLVDVPGDRLPSAASGELDKHLREAVAPQVPAALRPAFLAAVADGRVRAMQNKLMPAAPLHRPGALLLGDAFNMRHPLTGVQWHVLSNWHNTGQGSCMGSNNFTAVGGANPLYHLKEPVVLDLAQVGA